MVKKRILSILLVVIMLLPFAASAFADETTPVFTITKKSGKYGTSSSIDTTSLAADVPTTGYKDQVVSFKSEVSDPLADLIITAVPALETNITINKADDGTLSFSLPVINADTALTISPVFESEYNLWVGDVKVTPDNEENILGDGKAEYDVINKTLYLNSAVIKNGFLQTDGTFAGIYADNDLNIVLSGDSSGIYLPSTSGFGSTVKSAKGICVNGNLTLSVNSEKELYFTIDNSLTTSADNSYGVYVKGNLSVNNGAELYTKTGTAAGTNGKSIGVYANEVKVTADTLATSITAIIKNGSSFSNYGIQTAALDNYNVIATGKNAAIYVDASSDIESSAATSIGITGKVSVNEAKLSVYGATRAVDNVPSFTYADTDKGLVGPTIGTSEVKLLSDIIDTTPKGI